MSVNSDYSKILTFDFNNINKMLRISDEAQTEKINF